MISAVSPGCCILSLVRLGIPGIHDWQDQGYQRPKPVLTGERESKMGAHIVQILNEPHRICSLLFGVHSRCFPPRGLVGCRS